ncbi:HNH endonuclease [Dyella humi]|uniref:HNH endonuclease n=1 Tax=Dyella humi TaxID=1770547 RepID=A0ABW8IM71_9GAMM
MPMSASRVIGTRIEATQGAAMEEQAQEINDDEPAARAEAMRDSDATEHVVPLHAMEASGIDEAMAAESSDAAPTQPPTEALSTFVKLIENARYPSPRPPAWWLVSAIKKFDGLCAYCGRDTGSTPDVDAVIPVIAGGPQRPDAAVLCCKACKQERRRRDVLLWKPDASAKLRAMRATLALDSWNHLSRDPAAMRTPMKATEVVTERWRHPRFHCHGALLPMGGFIGWRDVTQVPSAIQLRLVFEHDGWRLRQSLKRTNRRNNTSAIFWFPTRDGAVDALWDVIGQNGLVRHADLGAASSSTGEAQPDSASDWTMMFPTVADLVRQRSRQNR